MHTQRLNLFIVDDDISLVTSLRNYLNKKFGSSLNILTFRNGESALKMIDKSTGIVILDYYQKGKNGNEILNSIKKINPETEVIVLSSNEKVAIALDSFRRGAMDYVIKGEKASKIIAEDVYKIISYPVKLMMQEWEVNKFVAVFFWIFLLIGIAVILALKFYPW